MPERYEAIVQRNGLACRFSRWPAMALSLTSWTGLTTNALIPFLPEHRVLMLTWLGLNDVLLGVIVIAAILTIIIEPALPEIKERFRKSKEVLVDTRMGEVYENHCYRCNMDVPSRIKHCPYCEKCVEEFDHHCQILEACIGKANYKYFATALFGVLSYMLSTIILCTTALSLVFVYDLELELFSKSLNKWAWATLLGFTALVLIVPFGFLSMVASWQIRARWLGLTQYEWFSKKSAERDARLAREAEEKAAAEAAAEAAATEEAGLEMPEIIVESIVPAQNQDVMVNIPDIVVVDAPAPAIEAAEIPMPPIVASDIPLEAFGFNNNNSDFDVVEYTPVEKFEPDNDFDVIEYTPVEKFEPDSESLNSDFDVIEDTSVEKFEPDNDFDVIEYTPVEKFEPDSESLNSDFDVIVDIPVEEFEPDNDFNVIEYTPVEKFEPDNDSLNSEGFE